MSKLSERMYRTAHKRGGDDEMLERYAEEVAALETSLAECDYERNQAASALAECEAKLRNVLPIIDKHRAHVRLSPGVGADLQRYALAVLEDVENDCRRARLLPDDGQADQPDRVNVRRTP